MHARRFLLALLAASCGGGGSSGPPDAGPYADGAGTCGDGLLGAGEVCDDGTGNGSYGACREDCLGPGPRCGDGRVDPGHEACDDGAVNGAYGACATGCAGPGPRCGDGQVEPGHEACDDGEANGAYGGCTSACARPGFPFDPAPGALDAGWFDDPPACSQGDWIAKYFLYRKRLVGDGTAAFPGFVSIGEGPGGSIPASRREPATDCAGHWAMTDCPRPDLADARGRVNWGDATIWLGGYLELLATEHAVLERFGLDPARTRAELRLALHALARVDEAAEAPFGVPPARDGFFLRDDVPLDFHLLGGGGYRFPRADGYAGFECVSSSAACPPYAVADGTFTSQDQVIGLLHGLALVIRLVPDGVVVDGVELRREARLAVHRMVLHLRSNGWRVTAPDGSHPPDAWGGNAIGFSDQLAKAANALCGAEFGVSDYRNLLSNTAGTVAFTGLVAIWDTTHGYNRTMALRLVAITGEWDADTHAARAAAEGKDLFALSYALLRGTAPGAAVRDWRLEAMLSSAPCGTPCSGQPGCDDPLGWMAEHRFWNPEDRFGSRHFPGEYNGLDYLVLHNLYLLHRAGAYDQRIPDDAPPPSCATPTLDELRDGAGATFDPADPCHQGDLARRFCGRSLAAWIDAAYRGEATIFVGDRTLECVAGTCQLDPVSAGATAGVDLILGSSGADLVRGGAGDDCIYGGPGDDDLEGGEGHDEVHGEDGDDRVLGDDAGAITGEGADRLFGEGGADVLVGGPGRDELHGGDGADELSGGDGADLLAGGPGDDLLSGGLGDDALRGGPGDDEAHGELGDDTLWGELGRDRLDGGGGDDWIFGGDGGDFLAGGDGADMLSAGDMGTGVDRLCGGAGDDTLWGSWDGDTCLAAPGADSVNGCSGTALESECDAAAFAAW